MILLFIKVFNESITNFS